MKKRESGSSLAQGTRRRTNGADRAEWPHLRSLSSYGLHVRLQAYRINTLAGREHPARRAGLQCDRAAFRRHRFWERRCYAENFGERFAKKVFKHREDHHGRFRHADAKPCGNFYSVRNRHAKVQNYQIRLEVFRFMNCFVAVNRLTNFELRTAFDERSYGVSYRSFVLGNENAFGHGKNRGKA